MTYVAFNMHGLLCFIAACWAPWMDADHLVYQQPCFMLHVAHKLDLTHAGLHGHISNYKYAIISK